MVGVDPYGSILAEPASVNDKSQRTGQEALSAYHVEGIGHLGIRWPHILSLRTEYHVNLGIINHNDVIIIHIICL